MLEKETGEVKSPPTFSYHIDNRVFQSITVKCLLGIEGVAFIEGNLIDHLLGRESTERIKGVAVEQDAETHYVSVKIELNIMFGIPIQKKAEEIQTQLKEAIESLTGATVASVHIVFRNVYTKEAQQPEEPTEDLEDMFATTVSSDEAE